mgnify:FL=1|tara:strand:+ start:3773 stop:6403 length:2631 start_codon:yes stop_codon:yes gene_type:complete
MTEIVQTAKKRRNEGKNKFSSRFKSLDVPLHGVRLPTFTPEKKYLEEYGVDESASNLEFLKQICRKRFKELKLGDKPNSKEYNDRMFKELNLIKELGFVDYMLLVWKVIRFCRDGDIPLGLGRGSAAGSLVLYLLHVTSIDPIKYGLFFERFVSKARAKKNLVNGVTYLDGDLMCDVDIDVCYYRRQEILQYLKKEFEGYSSKILTLNTLSGKLVMKECGKVVAEKNEVEMNQVSGMIPKIFGQVMDIAEARKEVPEFDEWCDSNPKVFKIAQKIKGLIKNKGVHASAVMLSYHKTIDSCPCELDSSKEPVSSFEADWVNKFNVKLDVLGLRTSSVVHECCKTIRNIRGEELYPETIDLDNPEIYELLNRGMEEGLSSGLFQIEGDLAAQTCTKVKPTTFEHLSAVLALARPGAMDYIDQYAEYTNDKIFEPVHPFFDEILAGTGGVCLYQEQMMQMAHKIGFTLDEAEILRRIVGKKKVSEVKKWKKKIRDKVKQNNLDKDVGDVLWKVLEDSANYSFNKSHSVSYAALAAATAYLKFKYPREFYLSLLKMTKYEPKPLEEIASISRELKLMGIKLLGPNLLKSEMDFSVEGENIRFGLTSIKGIAEKSIEKLESFKDQYSNKFEVFQGANQAGIGVGILSSLIQAGALDGDIKQSRSKIVAEAQLWNLLTARERGLVFDIAAEYNYDLSKIVQIMFKELKDIKGKPLIKESRMNTIRKHFAPYKEIYNKNSANEDFANWYYENILLGYTYGKRLKDVSPEYNHLVTIEDALQAGEGSASFIGTVEDTWLTKSKKGTPYFKITMKDESADCTVMIFSNKKKDNIEECKRANDGVLPKKGNIVIVKGIVKEGNTVFGNLAKVQDQKIYMKLSEIKS